VKLTQNQQEKAIAIRKLLESQCSEQSWKNYIDCTRAIAKMLDGLDVLLSPDEMKNTFDEGWKNYAQLWAFEHERVMLNLLGGNKLLLETVKKHPNAQTIISRIMERIKEQGGIKPGIDTSVEVADILFDQFN